MRTRRFIAACGLACSLAIASGCQGLKPKPGAGSSEPTAEESARFAKALAYFSQGVLAQSQDDAPAAISNFQQAVQLDPDHEELHFRLSMVLLQQRRPKEAEAVLRSYLGRHPDSEKALLWLALVQRASDRDDDALKTYEQIRRKAPTSPAGYIEAAGLLMKMGRTEEGYELLHRAVEKSQPNTDAIRVLSEILVRRAATGEFNTDDSATAKNLIKTLEAATREAPDDEALLYQLGDLYILDQRIDDAVACFERIEKLNPTDLRIKQKLAMSFVAMGKREKAIEALEAIVRERPSNGRVYYYLGELYEQVEDDDRAALNYELATKATPADPAPYLKLALMKADKSPADAIQILESGMKAAPREPRLPEMVAYIYMSQRDFDKAVTAFERVRDLTAEGKSSAMMPSYVLHHALALQHVDRLDDAAQILRSAIDENGRFLDAYMDLALRSRDRGPLETTMTVLEKLAADKPDDPNYPLYMGVIRQAESDYPGAVAFFEKAEKIAAAKPEEESSLPAQFYFWFGASVERTGDLPRAETLFRKCLELDGEHAEAMNYIAYMWAERGERLDEMMEMSQKSLELEPENPAFIDTFGWILFMKGDTDGALKEILRAANLLPEDPTIVDHLGDIMKKQGKRERAIEYWKRSFILDSKQDKVAKKLTDEGVDLDPLRKQAEDVARKKREEQEKLERRLPTGDDDVENVEPGTSNEPN